MRVWWIHSKAVYLLSYSHEGKGQGWNSAEPFKFCQAGGRSPSLWVPSLYQRALFVNSEQYHKSCFPEQHKMSVWEIS